MKKLALIVGLVCMAAMSQGATVTWQHLYVLYNGTSTTTLGDGFTAYLVSSLAYSNDSIISDWYTSKGKSATIIANIKSKVGTLNTATTTSQSKISKTEIASGITASDKAYFVIFNGDKMFVSSEKTAKSNNFAFNDTMNSQSTEESEGPLVGWFQAPTETVPEPTSGLLLLVGAGILGLRRRHPGERS